MEGRKYGSKEWLNVVLWITITPPWVVPDAITDYYSACKISPSLFKCWKKEEEEESGSERWRKRRESLILERKKIFFS